MKWSDGRILTTHAGSLPRPKALVEMYARRSRGEAVSQGELAEAVRRATREVVAAQRAAGVDVPNNGEQGREGFFLYLQHRLSGFGGRWQRPLHRDILNYPEFRAAREAYVGARTAVSNFAPPEAIGPVAYTDREAMDRECAEFEAAVAAEGGGFADTFVTAPSPGIVASAMRNRWYDSFEAYLDALADALAIEYEAVVRHGHVLQLDCPDLAMERHILYADRPLADFIEFVDQVVAAINRALKNVPREQVRLHVCWGNYEGPHDMDVPLADVLPSLLRANVGGFVLPQANPRHAHEVKCFEGNVLADDQVLVAGVLDVTSNFIEHPEVIAERLERAARAVGDPRRVMAATDCGFDTSAGMGRVASDVAWAKLKAMADGARLASERLF